MHLVKNYKKNEAGREQSGEGSIKATEKWAEREVQAAGAGRAGGSAFNSYHFVEFQRAAALTLALPFPLELSRSRRVASGNCINCAKVVVTPLLPRACFTNTVAGVETVCV